MKDGSGMAKKTSWKPPAKKGYKKFAGAEDGIPFGHPDNPQPTGVAKSNGWLKKKTGMELAKAILNLTFNDVPISPFLKQRVAEFYSIDVDDVTVETVLHFKQIEKASKGDTYAYQAFMNRALGMPKQVTEEIGNRAVINVNIEGEHIDSAPVIPIEGKVVNGG
jgi:hypothetical protein